MAVTLVGSGNDRIDFGDMSAIAGLTGMSIAITIKPSTVTAERIVTQWGGSGSEQAFLAQCENSSGTVGFVVRGGAAVHNGRKTGNVLSNGATSRLLWSWDTPGDHNIFHNGTDESLSTFIADDNVTSLTDSPNAVQVGHETDETADGIDGDYSEFAIWDHKVPDWVGLAYSSGGFSPLFYPEGLILYSRLTNTSDTDDIIGGLAGALTGGANAAHPSMIYPSSPLVMPWATAVAGGKGEGLFSVQSPMGVSKTPYATFIAKTPAAGGVVTPYYYQHLLAG